MKEIKDNFTTQANLYARYRPNYPKEVYEFLLSLCVDKNAAWDCATGNGQVATVLSKHFDKVYATDISEEQIKNAPRWENIIYKVERAEQTTFEDDSFDLVTVAQSIHWLDFDPFYKEVKRTTKTGGVFAILGYGLLQAEPAVNELIQRFYYEIIGHYWDKERKYIDDMYQTIPFPFDEHPLPEFTNSFDWTPDDLLGYFATWSAVQHYKKANNTDPVHLIKSDLEEIWEPGTVKKITFPILLRVAIIDK